MKKRSRKAKRLARPKAKQISPRRGGILAALRRSPLVGVRWYIEREVTYGRITTCERPHGKPPQTQQRALSGEKLEQGAGKLARRFGRQVVAGCGNDSALIGAGAEARGEQRLRRRAEPRRLAVQRDRRNPDYRP